MKSKLISWVEMRKRALGRQNLRAGTRFDSRLLAAGAAFGVIAVALPNSALAFNLYSGSYDGNNLQINLDTTISYQSFLRTNSPASVLVGPGNANGSEGDLDFQHGIVSNEFQAIPVFDLKYGDYGMHVSGQFYLNTSYLQKNQNDQPGTFNPFTPASNRDFTSATRNVDGENAQLLDAFAYGTEAFGADDSQSITLKVGQQTLLWGQSLFFSQNGIAAGQAPIDVITAQSLPNPQTQQVILPVGQAVVTYRPNSTVTFQGYYQFAWEPFYFQGVGAYFSQADVLGPGGQRLIAANIAGNNLYLFRTKDLSPPSQNGQFGLSAQATFGNYDLGLYGLRYDAKTPQLYLQPGSGLTPTPNGLSIGKYYLVYPRDIQIYGGSVSTTIGAVNVAGELSGRRNMPLVSGTLESTPVNYGNANSDPLYAVGSTMAAQASAIYLSPGVPLDPGGISFTGEIAANHVLSVDENRSILAAGRNATAAQFEVVVSPTYYSVLPNLTLEFPVGLTYNLLGRSQIDATENHGTGSATFGVTAIYRSVWQAGITFTDYLGKPDPSLNYFADRNYVSFNAQYSF